MSEKKTREEILKEAREKSAKLRARKTRAKESEGYKYYVHTDDLSSVPHRTYFRNLKSAKAWCNKHIVAKAVYDLKGKPVWVRENYNGS